MAEWESNTGEALIIKCLIQPRGSQGAENERDIDDELIIKIMRLVPL